MPPDRTYYVYIVTNRSGTLYTGVTNNLERRLAEHREAKPGTFTARYNIDRLVWYEPTTDVMSALEREKQIKGWRRARKLELIRRMNPRWEDLSEGWFPDRDSSPVGSE